jgi:hypothetical protein
MKNIIPCSIFIGMALLSLFMVSCTKHKPGGREADRVQPYQQNHWFWQFEGRPVMLLGANETDSPFLLPDQQGYYDSLSELGGNFTRYNVKQRRVEGLVRLFPFKQLPDGRYDLNQWEEGYWKRFEDGLRMTRQRKIIVQLELWDRFDIGCDRFYMNSPWRPSNTVTYTEKESGMPEIWTGCSDSVNLHPFFQSVPALGNNQRLLELQHRFADQVLSVAFKYDHVLYVIDNETLLDLAWTDYWTDYILDKAKAMDKHIEVSEMPWTLARRFPFAWQQAILQDPNIWTYHIIDHPELFSFCAFQYQPIIDARQDHYDRLVEIRELVGRSGSGPRPINAVKIFAKDTLFGGGIDPNRQARFWRPLMAGWAGVSLHRQHARSGYLGFGEKGRKNLSASRKFCDAIIPWECMPRQDLLMDREPDKAYLLCNPGKAYGVYFPSSGSIKLDLRKAQGSHFKLRWISIETGEFHGGAENIEAGPLVILETPDEGSNAGWACTLTINP